MSLVSVSNLLSPFRNRTQTVGLLVLAFFVFVVRWVASSDSHPNPSRSPSNARQESDGALSLKDLQVETAAFLDAQEKGARFPGSGPAPLPGDDSIGAELSYSPPARDDLPGSGTPEPGRSKDLADIRKRLGIE
jgi:hypothetical protein